jgi:hypothetical protein
MAITFPSNSDTDLYAYITGATGQFVFSFETTPTNSWEMDVDSVQDDDVILVFIAKDDDGGTGWTVPTSMAGITALSGGSGTYDQVARLNDSNRDEAEIAVYMTVITSASSLATSTNHTFITDDSGEEISWVAVIVRGTDVSGTLSNWKDGVTEATGSTQDTNTPDPPGVTTNTDGAVVVTMDGNSQNARHLGANDVTYAFLVTPPSGYTIESDTNGIVGGDNSQDNHPYGAPGRTQMGVGNGDAQMSWAYKTVTTAGSENPGAWGGFQTTRDHKYLTFAIKPASAGNPETSGTLNGGGGISSTQGKDVSTSGTLNGGGGIASTQGKDVSTTGTLNGGGGISATVEKKASTTGELNGGGGIDATTTKTGAATGELNGGGGIDTTTSHKGSIASELNGGGGITPTTEHKGSVTGELNGGGGIDSTTTKKGSTTAELNGGGGIEATATGYETHYTTAEMNGGGGISTTVDADHSATGELNGGGGLDATTSKEATTTAELNGGGGITPTVSGTHNAIFLEFPGEMNAGGGITAAAEKAADHTTSGELNGGGGISATVSKSVDRSAEVNGGGGISATVDPDHTATGTLNGGGGISAVTAKRGSVAAELNGGGGVDATLSHEGSTSATLSGGGGITPAVTADHSTTGTLNGGGGITATASKAGTTYAEVKLGPIGDPEVSTDHHLYFRYSSPDADHAYTQWWLLEGTTTIKSGELWSNVATISEVDYTLTTGEADLITDYTNLSVKLETPGYSVYPLRIYDIWFQTPVAAPPETSGELNGGGGIDATTSSTRFIRAFPALDEGLRGPIAHSGGGGISATVVADVPGIAEGELNGGGGISATVSAKHSVAGTINGGGGIDPTFSFRHSATGSLSGGGGLVVGFESHPTTATMNAGGGIQITYSPWFTIDTGGPGVGESDEGGAVGLSDEGGGLGLTDDGSQPGTSRTTSSIGST